MPSEIKPTAVRFHPPIKVRIEAYAAKNSMRSIHAAILAIVDAGLTASGFPSDAPPAPPKPKEKKAPKPKTAAKIVEALEEAVSHANGEEVPGLVVHERTIAPPAKPSLKDWLG